MLCVFKLNIKQHQKLFTCSTRTFRGAVWWSCCLFVHSALCNRVTAACARRAGQVQQATCMNFFSYMHALLLVSSSYTSTIRQHHMQPRHMWFSSGVISIAPGVCTHWSDPRASPPGTYSSSSRLHSLSESKSEWSSSNSSSDSDRNIIFSTRSYMTFTLENVLSGVVSLQGPACHSLLTPPSSTQWEIPFTRVSVVPQDIPANKYHIWQAKTG